MGAVFFFWKGQKGWKPLFFFLYPICNCVFLIQTNSYLYLSDSLFESKLHFLWGKCKKALKELHWSTILQLLLLFVWARPAGGFGGQLLKSKWWCVCVWVGRRGWVFFGGGGGCINSPLDGEKCSAAEMHSKVGGELHGFHDYQVLWLGCGFGSVVA